MKIAFKRHSHDENGKFIERTDLAEQDLLWEDSYTGRFRMSNCPKGAGFFIHMIHPDRWMSVDDIYTEYRKYEDIYNDTHYTIPDMLEALAFLSKHCLVTTLVTEPMPPLTPEMIDGGTSR